MANAGPEQAVLGAKLVTTRRCERAVLGAKLLSQMRKDTVAMPPYPSDEGAVDKRSEAVLGAKLLSQMRTEASRGASEEAIVGGESSEAVLGAKLLSRMRKDNTVSRCESAELRWADRDSFCVTSACAA